MTIYPDGSFYLEKGEKMPFVCPKCEYPAAFDASATAVTCARCGTAATAAEFSQGRIAPAFPGKSN